MFDDVTKDSAFRAACAACADMSTQERQKLVQIQHPEDLLKQLQEEHNKNANESAFQKGASKIQPVLRKLKDTLEVANPVFSIEPSAGAALGIVQMATTVSPFTCNCGSHVGNLRSK